ncbi:hypothetical protein JOC36_000823 [Weissella uvarum]|uniref:hypothetical protein n=1 Tax=Bacilli TaxID=91061 RepID=UPI001960EAE5|nr:MULTISPECIES: hypothetical protein [Bacilli]MBM7617274.1 hypothetical protein [Weissella uvarum]MCM0595222.1 hypothetical protein [Weissella uvarum]MCM0601528.1 hypothetical protein [Periweissella ghanensis]MDA5653793.1 hypothetical protein [Staphylococcus aureus]
MKILGIDILKFAEEVDRGMQESQKKHEEMERSNKEFSDRVRKDMKRRGSMR